MASSPGGGQCTQPACGSEHTCTNMLAVSARRGTYPGSACMRTPAWWQRAHTYARCVVGSPPPPCFPATHCIVWRFSPTPLLLAGWGSCPHSVPVTGCILVNSHCLFPVTSCHGLSQIPILCPPCHLPLPPLPASLMVLRAGAMFPVPALPASSKEGQHFPSAVPWAARTKGTPRHSFQLAPTIVSSERAALS